MDVLLVNPENRSDVRKFIQFPFDLYKGNRYWVPQLRSETRDILNKINHPFYQHSQADFFIAQDGKKTVGRIAAISNSRFNKSNNMNTAFFYFFDVIEDPEVSTKLFSRVFSWAKEKGHTHVYGPKGLLQGDGIGLLVEGFDYVPAVGISYNYPYYDGLVKQAGFEKKFDYYSGFVNIDAGMSDKVRRVAEKVKKRSGFWVKNFAHKDELLEIAPQIRDVYNRSFESSEGFSPITEDEILVIAKRLVAVADPRLIKLVYKDEEMIGFLFCYPNINRGLQKTNGRLFPFGWFHLMREFKTTRYMDANGIGILPEYQGLGSTAVIYTEMEKFFWDFNFSHIETVQTREDNLASFGEASYFVVDFVKTHRVYEIEL
jgi:hypothetical protein